MTEIISRTKAVAKYLYDYFDARRDSYYGYIQVFGSPATVNDYQLEIYDDGEVIIFWAVDWEYIDVLGFTLEEYSKLKEELCKYDIFHVEW